MKYEIQTFREINFFLKFLQNDFTKYFSSETDFFDSSGTLKYFQFGHHLKYVINEKYKYQNGMKDDTNDQ